MNKLKIIRNVIGIFAIVFLILGLYTHHKVDSQIYAYFSFLDNQSRVGYLFMGIGWFCYALCGYLNGRIRDQKQK